MLRRFIQSGTMFSDAFETLIVRVLGIGLMYAMTTVTARMLGAAEYGAFTAAWALAILLATLAPVGSDRILVRNLSTVSSATAAGRDVAITHICTGCSVVLMLVVFLILNVAGRSLSVDDSWWQTGLLATVLFVPIALTYLRQWVAIPLVGTRAAVMPEQMVLPVVFMGCLALLHLVQLPLTAVVVSCAFALSTTMVWATSLLKRQIRSAYREAWRQLPDRVEIRQRLTDGLPFVSVSIGGVVLQKCLPLVIAATCSFHATAQFAMGMQYAALPAIPMGVVNLCMIPRCARHFQNGEQRQANQIVRAAATMTLLLATSLALGIWLAGPLLVSLLGKSFDGINVILPTLLLASIVDSFAGPAMSVMQTMKLESIYSKTLYAYLPIQIGMVWWFSRTAGLEGAAMAYLLSRVIWNGIVIGIIWRIRGILCVPFCRLEQLRSFTGSVATSSESVLPIPERSATAA
jgi:O-antigen/teichoic acid export membrane protein